MIRMGKKSKLLPSELVQRAIVFFGPSGAGLGVVDQADCCARFQGGGGYVYVQSVAIDDQGGSNVTVEGREWEDQIKQFMRGI